MTEARYKFAPLDQDPDNIFKYNLPETWRNIQEVAHTAEKFRCLRLLEDLAALTKRFINEEKTIKEYLTTTGMAKLSEAVYVVEWRSLYFAERDKQFAKQARGYWKNLWLAIQGKS